jgi:hypothetical protein
MAGGGSCCGAEGDPVPWSATAPVCPWLTAYHGNCSAPGNCRLVAQGEPPTAFCFIIGVGLLAGDTWRLMVESALFSDVSGGRKAVMPPHHCLLVYLVQFVTSCGSWCSAAARTVR